MNAFTNNYPQNQGYNTGMPNFQPMGYAPQQPSRPQMTNPLTPEQKELLAKNEDAFDLKISPEEIAKAICTHKDSTTGTFACVSSPDGTVTCKICHQSFRPNDVDEEFVQKSVETIKNTLQTCKYIGVDLNNDVIRQFFAIMPYLDRVPKLYRLVNKIFNKYNQQNPVTPVNNGQNIVGMYNMLTNPSVPIGGMAYGYGGYGMPQQTPFTSMQNNMVAGGNPFYQQPVQQPPYGFNPYMGQAMPQQPAQAPMMNQPVANAAQPADAQKAPETVTVKDPVQL